VETAIIIAAISALGTVIVAIIGGVFAVRAAKAQKMTEEIEKATAIRAEQRRRESLLALELMNANTSLTIGVAMALKRGHANGEIEQGLKDVDEARKKYEKFHNEIVAGHLNGEG